MVSTEEILLRITGKDDTGSAFNSIQQKSGALKTTLGGAMTMASASMLSYAKDAVNSAVTAETEWMKFGNAVKNTGGNWEQQSDSIRKWVRDYSNSMGRSVADTRSAMTTYMNMGMTLQESQNAMKATSNYAAQMGVSQEEAAGQLQKAFMGNGRALKALGLDIKDYKDSTTGAVDKQKLLNDVLARTGGAADAYANSATAKFQRLNNTLAGLKTDFGAALMDAISPLLPVLQGFLNVINGLPGPVKTVGFAVIALGAGIGIIAGPLTSVIGLFEMMGFTLPTLSGLMSMLGAETAALSAEEIALAAAEAGLTAEELTSAAAHASNGVALVAEGASATGASGGFLALAAAELAALWPVLLITAAVAAFIVVVEKIGESLGWWSDFGTMLDAIRAGVMRLWEAFINSPQIQGVLQGIQSAFAALWKFLQPVFQWISDAWNNLFPNNGGGGPDIVGGIINAFSTLGSVASTVFTIIQTGFQIIWSVISPVITAITRIVTIFSQLASGQISLQQAITQVFTTILTMYAQIGTMLAALGMRIVSSLINRLRVIPARVSAIFRQIGVRITTIGAGIIVRAINLGARILSGIVNRIRQIPGRVGAILGQIPGRIASIAGAATGAAASLAASVLSAVVSGIAGLADAVYNEFIKIGDKINQSVSSAVAAATAFGSDIKNAVLSALGIASPGIVQRTVQWEFAETSANIGDHIGTATLNATNFGKSIVSGFNQGYTTTGLNTGVMGQGNVSNNNRNINIHLYKGALSFDARNFSAKECKQILINGLEDLSSDKDINLSRG